ncbi:AcrR family transcriptional regulator [Actinomadura luteofluorescens]|uniref:AcrR family transcriptional regulator n=1 Tax=Actinomadura luteofluorescens TaxID=46163 RepID=A0A7Y9JJE6_9ACTN|nr:TetR/AcrR family transcriptional regulator [Actinomadura luteofluorescens]NYD49329.1 AcrR family transcriptional regulator [Actinomadura luteofluorescens]
MGDAGLGAVADAAGVTRQTVYAHFPSREKLLLALAERLTGETVAAMDAADPEAGPAADALVRLLDAAARAAGRHPALTRRISAVPVSTRADHERHEPVADRIGRVIERGRRGGEFDDRLPVGWLVAAAIALAHAASEERQAGRMPGAVADDALRVSLLRLLGAS